MAPIIFPISPQDEEVFTSSITGKSYKYSELKKCWLRHQLDNTIKYVQTPEIVKNNLGDFNIVNTNSSAELYTIKIVKDIDGFNDHSLTRSIIFSFDKTPDIINNNFNIVNTNSSAELYTIRAVNDIDGFNDPGFTTKIKYSIDKTPDIINNNFNIVNTNSSIQLSL